VRTAKTAWKPTDVEIFQSLEKDADVNRRFEESSAAWLHQGWELDREKDAVRAGKTFEGDDSTIIEQQKREKEVGDLLSRPRVMTPKDSAEGSGTTAPLEADKAQEMFDRGYGTVKK
jgi:phospholipid-translocating ATPase